MELQLTGSPVRDVQHMLNVLSFSHPAIPRLVEDGVFGERTLEGVMIFQRDFALPVTGVVDYDTWLALRVQTDLIAQRDGAPIPLQIISPQYTPTASGTPEWEFVRTILTSLSSILTNFPNTPASDSENIRQIQRLAQLPVTGVLDRPTWGILVRLYHALVVRGALSGAG
ncbi:MAG TPA: peptidoglycan-binding protein [Candidatus Enterenecus avicola]|nr:peptidoglycan-binding protein [Candidatus Enterenecus avicola]